MIKAPATLMIGGGSRGIGKTAFTCAVLEKFGSQHDITAVKVTTIDRSNTNHHPEIAGTGLLQGGDPLPALYRISEETDSYGDKDTARMLASGAKRALWLQVPDAHLQNGIAALLDTLGRETVSIWESTRACRFVDPGASIMVEGSQTVHRKPWAKELTGYADKVVLSNGITFDIDWNDIHFSGRRWAVRMRATAILLAGGGSTRMGADKALLPIDGKPMIQRIHEQLRPWFSRTLVSSNHASAHAFLGVPVVMDEAVGKGPLMGIVSALKASPDEINFVTACDTPEVDIDLMRAMVHQARAWDAVVPRTELGRSEPLFAVYNKSVLPAFEHLLSSGNYRMTDALERCRVKYMPVVPGQIRNINTRSEYREYLDRAEETNPGRSVDDRLGVRVDA